MTIVAWTGIGFLPITFAVVGAVGIVASVTIAAAQHELNPYLPFISEAGTDDPQSGVFALTLTIIAVIGMMIITLRYMVVAELNTEANRWITVLNKSGLVVGVIGFIGMVIVGCYPMTFNLTAHLVGANTHFIFGALYICLQTMLSYMMCPAYNGVLICHMRLACAVLCVGSFITMMICYPIAAYQWEGSFGNTTMKPIRNRKPGDPGFEAFLISAIAEWMLEFSFLANFFTFVREFQKLRVQITINMVDVKNRNAIGTLESSSSSTDSTMVNNNKE